MMNSKSGRLRPDKTPNDVFEKRFLSENLKMVFEKNSITNISNAIISFLQLYKKHLRPDIYHETEDKLSKQIDPEIKRLLNTLQKENYNINYENNSVGDILNAIVSFISLSKNSSHPDIHTGEENLSFEALDEEFQKIMKKEFSDDTIESNDDKTSKTLGQKRFISPREFFKETAPRRWVNVNLQNSISAWLKKLANEHGIVFDFLVGVMHDFESKQVALNIDGNKYNLTKSLKKWEKAINDYKEDDCWHEIKSVDYIDWFEIKCEEEIKTKEMLIFEALNKNSNAHFREFMWLAYKTCKRFTILREKHGRDYRIFLKIGDILISIKL